MSVSMSPTNKQALVGIQLINTVFLFDYTRSTLTFVSSLVKPPTEARDFGFGKGVAWLNDTQHGFAIIHNVYSYDNRWRSSKISVYDSPLTSNSTPISIFPNIQQPLFGTMYPIILNIITTPNHLVLLDEDGYLFVVLSAPNGYYSSTVESNSAHYVTFSSEIPCIPGTYKDVQGIIYCAPCPKGTKNDGMNHTVTTCVDCATNTFCPLGAASDSISNDQLKDIVQVGAYPKSPDITGLDDILFFTLFTIGSTSRCVALSPLFWALLIAGIVSLVIVVMLVIRHCVKNAKATNGYEILLKILQHTDLIREGKRWVGGLATFCVIILTISCCVFSGKFFSSYPIETAEPSTYTCDTSLRNAKFTSSMQPLAIPAQENVQEMRAKLDNQSINLDVAFLNTVYDCTSGITVFFRLDQDWSKNSATQRCIWSNYILSYSVSLPFKPIDVGFTLPNKHTIGGLRVGLSVPGKTESSTTTVRYLNFSQTFYKNESMLGQMPTINLEMTKVVNNTSPLRGGDNETVSGIWTGLSKVNYDESFMGDAKYMNMLPEISSALIVTIRETPYYVLNEQSPIARLPEIIYHDFLFITMIIGMFVLVFVICELFVLPSVYWLISKCKPTPDEECRENNNQPSKSVQNDLENPTSNSDREGTNECTDTNVADRKRQPFISSQYGNHNPDVSIEMQPLGGIARKPRPATAERCSIDLTDLADFLTEDTYI